MKPIVFGALLAALLASPPLLARDVQGINVPDSITITGEKNSLTLNGAGFRKRFLVKVYVGALYTAAPVTQAERILDATAARVMRLHFLRAVDSETLAKGWSDSFTANHSAFEMKALRTRLQQFNSYMPTVKEGDVVRIELLPRGATRVVVQDTVRGVIEGVDFQRAVLSAWVGAKPADSDLKKAVLAGGK